MAEIDKGTSPPQLSWPHRDNLLEEGRGEGRVEVVEGGQHGEGGRGEEGEESGEHQGARKVALVLRESKDMNGFNAL